MHRLVWNWEPSVFIPLGVTTLLYGLGVRRLRHKLGDTRIISQAQIFSFAAEMAMLFIALVSPVDTVGAELLSVHMVQHLLLTLNGWPRTKMSRSNRASCFRWKRLPSGRRLIARGACRSPVLYADWIAAERKKRRHRRAAAFPWRSRAVATALKSQRLKAHELKEALWNAKQVGAKLDRAAVQRESVFNLIKQVIFSDSALTIDVKLLLLLPEGRIPPNEATYRLDLPIELVRRDTAVIVSGTSDDKGKPDPALIKAIARGFTWSEELTTSRAETVLTIAKRERVTDRYVSQLAELASPVLESSKRG